MLDGGAALLAYSDAANQDAQRPAILARCAPFVAERPHSRKCPVADKVFFARPLARAIWFRLAEGNVMQRSRGALAAEFVGHLAALGWIPAALAGAIFSVLLVFAPLVYAGDQREESFAVHHDMLLPVRTTVPIFR